MARTYVFRITAEGVDTLQKELEALGPAGARAFKAISDASAGLARTVGPASVQADALKAKLEGVQKIADAGAKGITRYTGSIQQAGYQIGDFAVQIASGTDPLRAFIQQGTQLISMFGPWGAVLGAAGAVVGVLAQKFLATEDAAKQAAEQMEAWTKRAEAAKDAANKLADAHGRVAAALQAELGYYASLDQRDYDTEVAKLKAMPKYIGGGHSAAAVLNQERVAQEKLVAQLLARRDTTAAYAGAFDDRFSGLNRDGDFFKPEKIDKAATAHENLAKAVGMETSALDAQIASLQKNAALAGTVGKAHAELAAIMEGEANAQADYNKGLRDSPLLSPAEISRITALTDRIEDQNRTVRDGASAQKELTSATSKESAERQKLAEREAELMLEPWKHALTSLQDDWTSFFEKIYSGGVDSFSSLVDAWKKIGIRFAAEMTSLLTFRPIVGTALNFAGLGGTADQLGLGGFNLLGGGSVSGQNLAAAGGGVGGGSVGGGAGGGFGSFGNLFSGTGLLGNGSSGIGSLLFGTAGLPAVGGSHPLAAVAGSSGLFGTGGGGNFGALLNSPAFGGVAAAGLSLLTSYLSTGKLSTSSIVSAAFTGIGTALGGPIGGAIGAVVGQLVGGLFAKKPKWKTVKSISGANLGFDDLGFLGVDDVFASAKGKGMKADPASGRKLGDAAADAFNDFFIDIGATFADDLTGSVSQVYKAKVKGKKKKKEQSYFAASFGGVNLGTATTADELIPLFLSGALAVGSEQGKVSGVSETTQTIFKNLFNANDRKGITDKDEIQKALDFSKFYDRLDKIHTPAQAAAEALRDLEKQMKSATGQAEDYGLAIEQIPEIFKTNLAESIDDQILALKDPAALAAKQLEIEHAAMVAQATKLGLDLTRIEELYGLKRQQIAEQGLEGVNSAFRQFFDQLTLGDLAASTPAQQFAQAQGRYNDVVAGGQGGADFISAAQNYLGSARSQFASGPDYAAIYADVLEKVRKYGNIPGFAGGGDHLGGLRMVGEAGMELEATGPARIWSAQQTTQILRSANDNANNSGNPAQTDFAAVVGQLQSHQQALVSEMRGMRDQMTRLAKSMDMQNVYARYDRGRDRGGTMRGRSL